MREGWEIKTLGELANIKTGRLDSNAMIDGGEYPFFTCSREIFAINEYAFDCEAILLAGNNASGDFNVKHYKGKFNAYQRTYVITIKEEQKLLYKYLNQQLINHLQKFKEQSVGTNTKFLKIGMIQGMEILLPPFLEQKQIILVLDEAFKAIAKAKANFEQNLENARELFEIYSKNIFGEKGVGWIETSLGDLCNIIGGGTPAKNNTDFYGGDILWATVRDMKNDIIVDTEHKITRDAVIKSSTNIIPKGNIVIATRVGLGKICMLENNTAINQDLRGVVPINYKKLSVDFLYYWFKSIADKIVEEGTGATVQGVKLPFIKSLKIYLPSLKEQTSIVQKLYNLSAKTKKLEAIYQQKINDFEELKKSILEKAFKGELRTKSSLTKVIQMPIKIAGINPTDLQAGIIAISYQLHKERKNEKTFGHVKSEKIIHLAEYLLNLNLERAPIKDALGPNDFSHLLKVHSRALKAGFFYANKIGEGYQYKEGSNFQKIIDKTKDALQDKYDQLKALINLLTAMDTQQAEIIATVYAGWNNLILDKKDITDEAIVYESRENWTASKMKIDRQRFFNAIHWMKKNGIIPTGTGKKVLPKSATK